MAENINMDLSDTAARSPGLLPTTSATLLKNMKRASAFLPKLPNTGAGAIFDQIRAKAKQALPAAPAAVLPEAPTKISPLVWGLAAAAGCFLIFRKKKGVKKHG